jgi:Putative zinc-finger
LREPSESERRQLHREVWELLPWLINGSLTTAQLRRVEQHLDECGECRTERDAQRLLRQQIQSEESVVHTPHASLRKLMARIDHGETASMPAEKSSPASRRTRWLAAAVVVQTVGLIALTGVMSWKLGEIRGAPRYQTLSAQAPAGTHGATARVVFSDSLPLDDFASLLRSYDAQIVAGPSEAGVYTLVFPTLEARDLGAVLARLRSNPSVRFAEVAAHAGERQ